MSELSDKALAELDRGNFTRLDNLLRDSDLTIFDILAEAGYPKEHLDEAFTWACMIGRPNDAERLLDLGADREAGMKTGLAGAHYAASGGHLEVIQMLIRRKVPLEIVNIYGGTSLGQALWSAVNEHRETHGAVVEALIEAGAVIDPQTLTWWQQQNVPSAETHERISTGLKRAAK
jgi:hypothetical protein